MIVVFVVGAGGAGAAGGDGGNRASSSARISGWSVLIQVSQASFSGVDGGVGGGVVDVGEDGAVGSSVSSGCL